MSRYATAGFGYLQQVEAYFLGLTQVGVMLSARDLDLVRRWRDAGAPVEAVCRGVRDAFASYESPPRSIWQCRKQVESEIAAWRERSSGAHGGTEGAQPVARAGRKLRDPTRVQAPPPEKPALPQMPGVWRRSLARLEQAGALAEHEHVTRAYRTAWRAMKSLQDTQREAGLAMAIFAIEAVFFDEVYAGLSDAQQHEVDNQLPPARTSALKAMSPQARKEQLRVWRRPMLAQYGAVAFFEP